jgi:putative toxin-antitoxin system antitoxin component (TIGR02293 family)
LYAIIVEKKHSRGFYIPEKSPYLRGQISLVMKSTEKKEIQKATPAYRHTANKKAKITTLEEPAVAYIATPGFNATIQYLGGKTALRGAKNPESDYEYMELINSGLPKRSFDYLLQITGLPLTEMADIFNITDRTLRRYKPTTILNREQSERALEIARLYSRGTEVFGDLEYFRTWMSSPIPALGGKQPKSFLGTSLGIGLLTKTLGRIEYGVYS